MFGQTLNLMTRSLREDTRLIRASLVRFAVLCCTAWMLMLLYVQAGAFGAPGLQFFQFITYLNFFTITLAGVSFFATAITEEKEEQTLGLLKMAGVSSVSVLIGKSTSRVLVALVVLTLQLPFILLAITLGGVLLNQVIAAYCTLLAYTMMLANLALLCSVICRRSNTASWMMGVLMFLFFFLPGVLDTFVDGYTSMGYLNETGAFASGIKQGTGWLRNVSAFEQMGNILTTGFAEPAVGIQVFTNVIAAVVFFLLACLTFDFFTRDEYTVAPARALPWRRTQRKSRRVWHWALVWKDFHLFAGGGVMIAVKFVAYGLSIFAFDLLGQLSTNRPPGYRLRWDDFGERMFFVALFIVAAELAYYAGRFLREEIRWQTLAAIAVLPGSTAGMTYSKLLGCLLGLVPAISYVAIGARLNPRDVGDWSVTIWDEPQFLFLISLLVLFIHVTAYLSLFVKWGALPLSFVLVYVGGYLMLATSLLVPMALAPAGFSTPGYQNGVVQLLTVCTLLMLPVLHWAVLRRLKTLAGR